MNIKMRFPGGKRKAITLSYDDGVEQDVKLIEIMKKNGLKGTFNVNSGQYAAEGTSYPQGQIHRRMTRQQASDLYKDSGMEVAVHGYKHVCLGGERLNLCMDDLVFDRETLEEQFETIIRGMAYACGSYSDKVVECLKCVGIVYSRTTISTHGFKIPNDWLRLEATCHHKDPKLMELAGRFVEDCDSVEPWLFYLWGHSFEFEADNNWNVIEEFAEYVGNREDIWYATNIEIYEYVEAFRKLVYSLDKHRIYNPTAFPLYFENDKVLYCLNPGEFIYID